MYSTPRATHPWGAAAFGELRWIDAHDSATTGIATHYAYTTHKQIDWDHLIAAYRPKVLAAAGQADRATYFTAMKDPVAATKDGHCEVEADSKEMGDIV